MKNKIRLLDDGAEASKQPVSEIQKILQQLPEMIMFAEIDAKMKRVRFLALRKEGFTQPEALELCKK